MRPAQRDLQHRRGGRAPGGECVDDLIAQADQALYMAKNAGRNRTRVADEAPEPEKPALRVIQGRP